MSKIDVGARAQNMDIGAEMQNITRINLVVDSEHIYTAGDDTGRTLEVECPWGTQAMADNILANVSAVQYKPFSAERALLDPAFEPGDAVTVGGLYSQIISADFTYNSAGLASIGAPDLDEIDDEYPAQQTQNNSTKRQLAYTRSLITKTAEQIRLEVQSAEEAITYLELDLDAITGRVQDAEGNIATLELTATELRSEISGKIDGDYAQTLIDQTLEGIEMSVSSANGSTVFTLTADGAELSTQTLNLTVDAVNVTGTLKASQINLTGAITWGDLSDTVQGDIDEAWEMAYDAQSIAEAADAAVNAITYTYNGKTYIDEDRIMAGSVIAGSLMGGEVKLLTAAELQAGGLDITGASTSDYAIELWSNGALRMVADDGAAYLEAGGEHLTIDFVKGMGYTVSTSTTLMPSSDGDIDIGAYAYYWDNAYINQCYGSAEAASTSDRNKKNSISYDLMRYDAFFDCLLPAIYKLNNGTSGRFHVGMIAQDVAQALADCGIPTSDFAGYIEIEDSYALRYGEFIALLIWQVQQLKARVAVLEGNTDEI